ncbi:hypothetical protein MF672_045460 [Actinomadura sp. ATCC 31491]|uniref:Uncharacterized protein n=1 Tax=Actinomadura luzonensis TaxID=2805427 RepID=A0ABT0G8S7_9ACTN|nr:hypothetical protein [Actinomadura luzonensis]MCK2221005.1 hypothetical protein [Actinomadura luzonensis]
MSDQHIDPAGNTQAFRAFAQAREEEAAAAAKPKKSPLLPIIAVVLGIAIIGVVAFLLLR